MKRFKKAIALMLALVTVFALTISANAVHGSKLATASKDAAKIGVPAVIYGEIWIDTDTAPSGIPWMEPSAVTIVDSRYTMAEVTVEMECQYNDTGELVSSGAYSSDYARNTNRVETGCDFGKQRLARIVCHSAHGATYTRSDVLYMTTFL